MEKLRICVILHGLLLAILVPAVTGLDSAPVFLLDDNRVLTDVKLNSNPMSRLTTEQFSMIVQKALTKATKIMIFTEDHLSMEDVSARDLQGTPYPKLRAGLKQGSIKYHPAVIKPYPTIMSLIRKTDSNTFNMSRATIINNPDLINKKLRTLYIDFIDDPKENNSARMRRHDSQILDLFKFVRRTTVGDVVAFYIGKQELSETQASSEKPASDEKKTSKEKQASTEKGVSNKKYNLSKEEAKSKKQTSHKKETPTSKPAFDAKKPLNNKEPLADKQKGVLQKPEDQTIHKDPKKSELKDPKKTMPEIMVAGLGALLKFGGVTKSSGPRPYKTKSYSISRDTIETLSATSLREVLNFGDFDLQFNFQLYADHWEINHVDLLQAGRQVGSTNLMLNAHWNHSLICNEPITIFSGKESFVTVYNYQIEPFFNAYTTALRTGRSDLQPIALFLRTPASRTFHLPEHCAPFFPAAVLGAAVVVFTMVLITTGGLVMMLDLRVNDKYDDVNTTKRLTFIEN